MGKPRLIKFIRRLHFVTFCFIVINCWVPAFLLLYYYSYIALAQAVLTADIFLMGELQQVAKGQEDAFTLQV